VSPAAANGKGGAAIPERMRQEIGLLLIGLATAAFMPVRTVRKQLAPAPLFAGARRRAGP
jgi:hypothetical protein